MAEPVLDDERYTTIKIDRNAIDELRDAVAHRQKTDPRYTLQDALRRGIAIVKGEIEHHFNRDDRSPPREGELPRGNPRKRSAA